MQPVMKTNALDSFSAQEKQPLQVLDTDSFPLYQMVEVMESITVIMFAVHISLGIKPFIFNGISLALDRKAASGSS